MSIEKIKKWIVFSFLIFFIIYGLFESYNLILGPKINILEPKNGANFLEPIITIKGNAKNISFISINDRQIYVDKSGYFEDKILLLPGYNIISVKAKDRFGKNIEKRLQLFLEKDDFLNASSSLENLSASSTENLASSTKEKQN